MSAGSSGRPASSDFKTIMNSYRELDFNLTPYQKALKEGARQFAKSVLRPAAAVLDRMSDPQEVIASGSPLWSALKTAYSQKFHTALIPAEVGGLGFQGLSLHIVLEELGWGSADFAASLGVTGFPFASVAATGKASG